MYGKLFLLIYNIVTDGDKIYYGDEVYDEDEVYENDEVYDEFGDGDELPEPKSLKYVGKSEMELLEIIVNRPHFVKFMEYYDKYGVFPVCIICDESFEVLYRKISHYGYFYLEGR